MIRCYLSRLMGEHKLKIADVARETGLNRNTITLLYKETATRVDLESIEKLCELFDCGVADLFERLPSSVTKQVNQRRRGTRSSRS
ncbi:MAG: helix-turn-helix domain-containing protein [Gammaproteobacteria bacterium]